MVAPDVAETVMANVPAGVPVTGGGGGGFPPPQATMPPARAKAQRVRHKICQLRLYPDPPRRTNPSPSSAVLNSTGARGREDGRAAASAGRAVVVMVSVVLAAAPFGFRDAGVNAQFAPVGTPVQEKVTDPAKPCWGATSMLKLADAPAVTVAAVEGMLTV